MLCDISALSDAWLAAFLRDVESGNVDYRPETVEVMKKERERRESCLTRERGEPSAVLQS